MTDVSFQDLPIDKSILRALNDEGYTEPTEVQRKAIPHAADGKDVLAVAPTGTGKTAAFSIPLLQKLAKTKPEGKRDIRALILAPTRELALQVDESLKAYGNHLKLKSCVIMGGVKENPQIQNLKRGVDILVATPGRLLDLMNRGFVKLDNVEVLVLDEADRMLDMGFIDDVRKITRKVPEQRQTLFFSATMPKEVTSLAHSLLKDPVRVDVESGPISKPQIEQKVMFVEKRNKQALLTHILKDDKDAVVLVFSRTKHRADRIVKNLTQNKISAAVIHSNKTQGQRQKALRQFAEGDVRVLIATNIAARGIDVDGITHVVNFDLSDEAENHVHRVGRTARAGAKGIALSFCDREELKKLSDIEKQIDEGISPETAQPFHSIEIMKAYHEQITSQPKAKKSGGWPKPRRRRTKRRRNGMRMA